MFHVYNGNKSASSCPYLKAQFPLVSHQRDAYIQYQKVSKITCMSSLKTSADLCVCMYTHISVLVFVCAMMYIIIRGNLLKNYVTPQNSYHSGCSNFVSAKNDHLALYLETYLSPCFSLYRVIFISILQVTSALC